jgi:hypothetical protein
MQELCGKVNNLRRQNVMEANRFYIEKGIDNCLGERYN